MAFDPSMADAVTHTPASSAEYNKVIDNVLDLDSRNTSLTTRVSALESSVTAGAIPIALLRKTNTQAIAAGGVLTAIQFNIEDVDSANGHDLVTNPSRWTCPAGWAGWYRVTGGGAISGAGTSGYRLLSWTKNGSLINGGEGTPVSGSVTQTMQANSLPVSLAVGDYLELNVKQTGTAATPELAALEKNLWMSVEWIRGL